MAHDNTQFTDSVKTLLNGLDGFLASKSVVGNPMNVGGNIILPLMDIQLGVGAGAYNGNSLGTGGGMGAKMTPSAVLIIKSDGNAKLVNIKNQDSLTKILDMVPDVVDKLRHKDPMKDPEVQEAVSEIKKNGTETVS
ncbi:MAG: GerW family sporulation protein [Lachnospiraceae bacterium]|nr:GerW family sporulation protein [Lachnospiraceae bacterium]